MNIINIFDVDGTLTPCRLPATPEFEEFFIKWMNNKIIYLCSGSDCEKLKEQLSPQILHKCNGVFCSMGNQLYINNKLIYSNDDDIPAECYSFLEYHLHNSKCPIKKGENHFEKRVGMLNFSVIGRDVSQEVRNDYSKWDIENKEREMIADEFNERFSKIGYQAKIGGQISLDIQKIGNDKSQILDYILTLHPGFKMVFYGDRTLKGGNDYDLAYSIIRRNLGKVVQVKDYQDCKEKLLRC